MSRTDVIIEPGRHEVIVSRVFNAPLATVYRACTDAGLVASWWAPARCHPHVEQFEVRVGGRWRIVNTDGHGHAFAASEGVYHTVVPDERTVRTVELSLLAGQVQLQTETFVEHAGRTTYTSRTTCQSVADRDDWIQLGAESGLRESMDRLQSLLGAPMADESRNT